MEDIRQTADYEPPAGDLRPAECIVRELPTGFVFVPLPPTTAADCNASSPRSGEPYWSAYSTCVAFDPSVATRTVAIGYDAILTPNHDLSRS